MRKPAFALLAPAMLFAACGGSDSSGGKSCPEGFESREGLCVDPVHIHDPADRLDFNNVLGDSDFPSGMALPRPPNSGFRLIAPPYIMQPYEEAVVCVSWQLPELSSHNIYVAEFHTTAGVHHGNLISTPIDAILGPNPSPGCRPGAEDFVTAYAAGITGSADMPQVLFASSTQLVGTERRVFPEGMAMRLGRGQEAVIGIHYLNPTPDELPVDLAYDFYTAPADAISTEIVPFAFFYNGFTLPAGQITTLEADCAFDNGGQIVSMMPHMHEHGREFRVLYSGGERNGEILMEDLGFDQESDIHSYDPAISIAEGHGVKYSCTFDNYEDQDLTEGIGKNEMCILLGYMYPPFSQVSGFVRPDTGCFSIPIGEMAEWNQGQ